ncbi:aldo/keto reductase [Pediococcus parvulus]
MAVTKDDMQYTKLGKTDIDVSKICIGAMSFGKPGTMHDWSLDYPDSEKIIKHALGLGINFFDTANTYSKGTSEEYLGRALKENNVARDKVVLASKVYFNPGRLSSEAIHREIDGSLKRLGTDYLDLYIIHRFDYDTPIEETMSALNDLVKAGKVRAIGASAMYGYQFQNMQQVAKDNGWAQFQTMENHYNLLYREDERELIPICKQWGVSLMPYSPLAAGHLSHREWQVNTLRSQTDRVAMGKYDKAESEDVGIVARVDELAKKYNVSMSQIALAWQWAKGVMAPIVGSTKASHLDAAVEALAIKLTDEDVHYLEELYVPHEIVGAIDHNPAQGTVLIDEKK